jgi:hypothetical protein
VSSLGRTGRARIHWSNRSRAAAYLSRNQKFESISLQRRVSNEPAPLAAETPVNAPIGSVPPGYRSPRASAPLRILRKAAQPRSAACGVSADSRNAPTAPGSSHRHPAPFNPAPHPQHHRWLALSNSLTHDQNPAAAVGTRIATSASVRAEERAVDRRILVDDGWRFVGHVGPLQQSVPADRLLKDRCPLVRRPGSLPAVVRRGEVGARDQSGRSIRLQYHHR